MAFALLPAQALAAEPDPHPEFSTQFAAGKRTASPEPAPQLATPAFHSASADDDCAELQADIKARALVASNGKTAAACVTPGDQSRLTTSRLSTLADRTPVPLPDYCYDRANGAWWMTRTNACAISLWKLEVRNVSTGALEGEMGYLQADLVYTDPTSQYWAHQVVIDKTDGWGKIGGTTVSGSGSCKGDCTYTAADIDFPTQTVTESGTTYGDITPRTTVTTAGTTGTGRTTVTYRFANPAWTVPANTIASTPSFDVRCDNATPGVGKVGCVIKDYKPVHVISLTGPNPDYARHIRDAQASGLRGAYPDGLPFERLTDERKRDQNGDRACPQAADGGYPRPTGYSCDEYPFRSTWQGASTGYHPYPNPGRTFDWCQISALPTGVTGGPAGWSACMIPVGQNSSGGALLNSFYQKSRVIEKDEFYVWIVD
ncbi:NucA/NucB deoxyribonuclease domain-containing protein [Streptomyces shenzhenensis]|uniref:NucA/NucB deoxyribonuclease domain-containing protein n=1 Tax=Streptomyces shenzhenensis TaxID=943815 RepID=UPI003807EC12